MRRRLSSQRLRIMPPIFPSRRKKRLLPDAFLPYWEIGFFLSIRLMEPVHLSSVTVISRSILRCSKMAFQFLGWSMLRRGIYFLSVAPRVPRKLRLVRIISHSNSVRSKCALHLPSLSHFAVDLMRRQQRNNFCKKPELDILYLSDRRLNSV